MAHAYEINLKAGTIRGSEWISNCLYCITSPEAGIAVFEQFLAGELPIGYDYPPAPDGLVIV
ncbi:Transporter [Chlamydia trachomatis]|nr:Transporter [Chlamydia trachomatis]